MFFPIKDDNPTSSTPYFTIGLIVLNVLVFFYSKSLGMQGFNIFTYQYGYIPYELVNSVELSPAFPASAYFTPFSSMFMHAGWMHLIGNMLFLWIYGNNIEDYFGPAKFIFFYIAGGIAAITLYTIFGASSEIPLIGASGAVAGVMGGYMILYPRAKITVLVIFFFIQFIEVSAKTVLGFWFGLQILMSVMGNSSGGGVAWLAHVGGFAFGYLVLKLVVKLKGGGTGTTRSGRQKIIKMDWQ